jgi:diadenosine tetraphosphatase ApaH/serine/threonine PP2A family protein phosphatase
MRYLVLSDIHANIDALTRVLADAGRHGDAEILLLGDLVGYGADPNGVIDRVRGLRVAAAVRGNHDRVACGLEGAEDFNDAARESANRTAEALTDDNREYLRGLPVGPLAVDDLVEICHGTPFDEDAYVFDEMDAVYALRTASRPVCLFGHTHSPLALSMAGDEVEFTAVTPGSTFRLKDGVRYLINVGSVGQPRDGDARAAYGIVDTERREITCYRVEYPVDQAQARIRAAGLPEALARRLGLGR